MVQQVEVSSRILRTSPRIRQEGSRASRLTMQKIQQMLEGTLAAKEDTALKAYFKQQGLSQQEAEQAMSAFKTESKKTAGSGALQSQVAQAQASASGTGAERSNPWQLWRLELMQRQSHISSAWLI